LNYLIINNNNEKNKILIVGMGQRLTVNGACETRQSGWRAFGSVPFPLARFGGAPFLFFF
jgi:hypothetical protein